MEYIVYVLKDDSENLYKGMTSNLEKRLKDHKAGKTKTTRTMRELKVVYTKKCGARLEARKREKYLKSAAGRRFLKKILDA